MKKSKYDSETFDLIVSSATELFNQNGYAATSISDITKKADFSKAILYHYFKSKDEVYLHCVKMCTTAYRSYMKEKYENIQHNEDSILKYIKDGYDFFEIYPKYRNLFSYVLTQNPPHLENELLELRESFKDDNKFAFLTLLKDVKLGQGVSEDDLLNFVIVLQNSISAIFGTSNEPLNELRKEDEMLKMVKIFLNGLKQDVN